MKPSQTLPTTPLPAEGPIARRIEDFTLEELDELEKSPIPEETREFDYLVPKNWGRE